MTPTSGDRAGHRADRPDRTAGHRAGLPTGVAGGATRGRVDGQRRRSRLRLADLVLVAVSGIFARRLRAALTAAGIALGVASLVAVVGLSSSSRADLLAQIDALGTGLLRAGPGQTVFGEEAVLPATSAPMAGRIGPVQSASATIPVEVSVRRSEVIADNQTSGLTVRATDADLLTTLEGELAHGRFLDATLQQLPAVVLGAVAATRLGIEDLDRQHAVDLGGERFQVVGILAPFPLAPELDRSALIGSPVAEDRFGTDPAPGQIYVRTTPDAVDAVRSVLPATVHPSNPEQVDVARPSDALAARAAVDETLTSTMLALGAVALLVGAIGIANIQIVAVLERRTEIGLRRALGARRRHLAGQFLAESSLLAGLGGCCGVLLGAVITVTVAGRQGWTTTLPMAAVAAAVTGSVVLGAAAGLAPALRAARIEPASAIRPRG